VETAQKIGSAREAIDFLLELERVNRNSLKRVMLDCPAAMAKEILINHVNNVHLGRRNFHYLMSSLILDDDWDSQVAEFGAVNVTGFRLIDPDTNIARQFMDKWRQKRDEDSEGDLTAVGVLAYDAVHVLHVSLVIAYKMLN
jgi:ionotropic glutamate receptor